MGKNILINKVVAETEEPTPKKVKVKKPSSKKGAGSALVYVRDVVNSILRGTILTRKNVIKSLPLILFIVGLIVIYIWNNYMADKKVREISKIKKELKELRSEHITTRSELMYSSKQSEIARRLDTTGIKESVVPPQKIFIKE